MKYMADGSDLTNIANAIRAKGVTGSLEFPDDFVSGIGSITTGTDVSDTTAAAGDVLSGKYFYTAAGVKTEGSIASKSSSDMTASTLTVTAPAGHYASDGVKTLSDANLVAGNIKKDVEIFGVTGSYEGGGGGATVESLTVTQNGTYTAPTGKAYSPVVVNVPSSHVQIVDTLDANGGTIRTITAVEVPDPNGNVIFIDYDGTVVASKTTAQINAMTSDSDLPANPTHTGLTAQGWNWTVAQIKAQLTAMPTQKVYVGQMYTTTSGATEIDVEMIEGRLNPILTICVNGTISVDWGDNTTADTVTGTSLTTRQAVSHTYQSAGSYTIKISKTSGTGYTFYGSSSYLLLRKNTTANHNRVYANCVKGIRIGNGITSIGDYAFNHCDSLTSVTIPSGVTSFGNYAFNYCYSLASITIPSNVASIGNYTFQYCYSLASITMPSSVTSIGTSVFGSCYSLASITIPSNVTSIDASAFSNCYAFASITIPSNVTSIGNYAFQNCYGVAEYHVKPTTPPTLGTTVFASIVSDCVIYVPNGYLNTYKTATGWSDYASYMQEEPAS